MPSIEYLEEPLEIKKSIYAPLIVKDTCPQCGKIAKIDLREKFLHEVVFNEPFEFWMYHPLIENSECQFEWRLEMVLRIGIFEHKPAIYNGWLAASSKIKIIKVVKEHLKISILDAKKWAEKYPRNISAPLAAKLETVNAVINWKAK